MYSMMLIVSLQMLRLSETFIPCLVYRILKFYPNKSWILPFYALNPSFL